MKEFQEKFRILLENAYNKGFFHLLTSNIMLRIMGFGSQLLVIKFLTPTEMGQIKTLQIITELAALVAAFGFNTATLKLCSDSLSLQEKTFVFRRNLIYSLLITVMVMILLYLLSVNEFLSPDGAINFLLPFFILSLPSIILIGQITSFLQALKKIKVIATAQVIYRIFAIVLVVVLTWRFGIYGFIGATVLAAYIYLPFIYTYCTRFLKAGKILPGKARELMRRNFYYSRWSFAALLGHKLTQYADIILLNYMILDREGFGFYSIATLFLIPLREINNSVRTISVPYLNEKKHNQLEFIRVLSKYRRVMLIQSIVLVVVAWLVVPFIITYFYGDRYEQSSVYFKILVIGFIFQSYMSLLPTSLISLGLMKYNFFSMIIYFPIVFVINYVLIDEYGLTGAAVAQVVSSIVILLVIMFVTKYALAKYFRNHAFG